MNEQLAAIGAKWWADHLRAIPSHEIGDPEGDIRREFIAMMFCSPLLPEMVDQFEQMLKIAILREMESQQPDDECLIQVDYEPNKILQEVVDQVGIDRAHLRFPVKSYTAITSDHIESRKGYGGQVHMIYPKK